MKTFYIPVKVKFKISESKINEISKNLPNNIVIVYSIQYKRVAEKVKRIFDRSKDVKGFVQVLGCSKIKLPKRVGAILLVGSGKFHGVSLAIGTGLPVYILDEGNLSRVSEKEVEKMKELKKASYVNFLNSKRVGVLISLKPGQENLWKAFTLEGRFKDKELYYFLGDNINIGEFENFPEIESWVNTACPKLDLDSNKIVNLDEIV